ncbi:hypothetical protein MINTM005_24060 [Mycobacterium intracellulare]|nr:hypothetical protein MINTM005_24060 [Mycobacterium intracellulare]BCO94266.1 hypothetical protein MINTM016_22420 [Mycobacterium intracellulare]
MIIGAVVAVGGVAAIALATAAHADADTYIGTLDVMGVPYRDRPAAIQFGNVICRALRGGTSFDTLVNMTTSDGYYSTYQAKALIGAAVAGLCPDEQVALPSD